MKTKFKKSTHSKKFIKSILVTLLLFLSFFSYSQVTTTIKDFYSSGINGYILDCNFPIDITNNNSINLDFDVELIRSNQNSNNSAGLLKIYYKTHYNNTTELFLTQQSINSGDWNDYAIPQEYRTTVNFTVTLHASNFNFTDGVFYAVYEPTGSSSGYSSCEYDVVKNPRFTMNNSNLSIPCTNNTPVTFTVTNVHNHSGNLSYNWTIGSGWLYNGNAAPSTITTSGNTLTLTPNANPPNNVSVVPVLDGVNYPTLTSTVSLSAYNPSNSIVGSNGACSFESYSISNLPPNTSVAWSISNTSIASLTSSSGNQTNINVSGRGVLTLTATLTNSCGQSAPITKELFLGYPDQAVSISGPTVVGKGVLASYATPTIEGATEYEWRLPYPYQTVTTFNYFGTNWELLLATSTSSNISTFVGYGNSGGLVQVWGKNNCGNGGATSISVTKAQTNEDIKPGGGQYPRAQNSGLIINDNVSFFPNPVKDNLQINIKVLKEKTKYFVQLFDLNSRLIKEMILKNRQTKINLKGIANGTYIVKLISNDNVKSQKIIVNH